MHDPDLTGPRVYLADTSIGRQLNTSRPYPPDVVVGTSSVTRMKMLISFHYYRDTDIDQLVAAFPSPPEVFADSGAYSAMSVGAAVDVHEYAKWITRWSEHFHVYVGLDVIGDAEATTVNQRIMEEEYGLTPVPTFHGGEPWEYLHAYCERYPYVALGGMVASEVRATVAWLAQAFLIGREYGTRFHGFGQTRHEILRAIPFYSVDSSSWGAGHRYGQLYLWDPARVRWVRTNTGTREVRTLGRLVRDHGGDPAMLATPGCGQIGDTGKTTEQARIERAAIIGVNVNAWVRYEAWLRKHHGPISHPEGYTHGPGDGLHLYLADARGGQGVHTKEPDLAIAQETIGPRVYLAEGIGRNLRTAADVLAGEENPTW